MNARHWLPQHRERVYITGVRTDLPDASPVDWDSIFPEGGSAATGGGTLRSILQRVGTSEKERLEIAAAELTAEQWAVVQRQCEKQVTEDAARRDKQRRSASALKGAMVEAEEEGCGGAPPAKVLRVAPSGGGGAAEEEGTRTVRTGTDSPGRGHVRTAKGPSLGASRLAELRGMPVDGKAPTLTSGYHGSGNFTSKYMFEDAGGTRDGLEGRARPRFLTPRECARAMGFPDSFVLFPRGDVGAQDPSGQRGRAYRQLGNAVCPPVVEAVGAALLKAMGSAHEGP